jgi:hypothetical protein
MIDMKDFFYFVTLVKEEKYLVVVVVSVAQESLYNVIMLIHWFPQSQNKEVEVFLNVDNLRGE